jgi:carbon storage regulator
MLVLTRNVDQSIVIGGNIRVTVLSAQGDKIRLGISAPDAVRVDREEVHARLIESGFCDHPLICEAAPAAAAAPYGHQPH